MEANIRIKNMVEGKGALKVLILNILMLLVVIMDGFKYPEADAVMSEFGYQSSYSIHTP